MTVVSPILPAAPAPEAALSSLLERLEVQHGFTRIDAAGHDAFANAPGDAMLLLTDDPTRYPETWDVAVVLPEVIKNLPGRFRVASADPAQSRLIQPRYGFARWPALVFLRDGQYVGVIEGMLDWDPFVSAVAAMLDKPVSRPPTIGIAVRGPDGESACH